MRRLLLTVMAALALGSAAPSLADPPPRSDIESYPALPAPSEAQLAAARQLDLTEYPWVQSPNVVDFLHVFPRRALRDRVGGSVELNCLVVEDHRLACRVVSETPPNYAFAEAAMTLSGKLRVAPTLDDGQPTLGGKLRWTVDFASDNRLRTPGSPQS